MAQIVLDDVTKVYGGGNTRAVDSLSLDIPDGDFMVFVGPSGCGKSTALRMIAGLEDITSGTISIGERVVNDLPPKDRDIAMVFQNYALYPHMTVEENTAFGLQLRKTPKQEQQRRVSEVAKMLGLEPYLKRKPAALSGGQRQRVAMGRAIVREPQAYLMDEPLSNLDAKLRVSMRANLAQLHDRLGTTTIYVTHDLVEAKLVRDDGTAIIFADHKLPIPPKVFEQRRGLDSYIGRNVIVGVRPSDFEDAAFLQEQGRPVIKADVAIAEELGSEVNVIFPINSRPVQHDVMLAKFDKQAQEADETEALTAEEGQSLWTARVNPKTQARAGRTIELAIDQLALHYFDPESGEAIQAPHGSPSPN